MKIAILAAAMAVVPSVASAQTIDEMRTILHQDFDHLGKRLTAMLTPLARDDRAKLDRLLVDAGFWRTDSITDKKCDLFHYDEELRPHWHLMVTISVCGTKLEFVMPMRGAPRNEWVAPKPGATNAMSTTAIGPKP